MIEQIDIQSALDREMDLLAEAAKAPSRPRIWFWQSQQALVAPRKLSVKAGFAEAQSELAKLGWPVHIRATGGDVTPQGPGVVNVTLVFTPNGPPDLQKNYDRLCSPIEQCLGEQASRGWNPGAFCDGEYNVQWQGKKFAGTAQRLRKSSDGRSSVLAHALMLMAPPKPAAIDALNLFLDLMDEPRQIEPECHTGLPDGLAQKDFIENLHQRYIATLP